MMYTFRPLGPWAEPETKPRRGSGVFKATWSDTLSLLGRELEYLNAKNVVIQVDVREGHIRNDGMLKADAKVGHPGVRLSFDSKHGPLMYASDAHAPQWSGDMAGWKANVRGIALGLQALRAVDRYGITRRAEQYQGYSQLPAGATPMGAGMTERQARQLIVDWSNPTRLDEELDDPDVLRRAFRSARAETHPDRAGDSAAFLRLEQAGFVLGLIA